VPGLAGITHNQIDDDTRLFLQADLEGLRKKQMGLAYWHFIWKCVRINRKLFYSKSEAKENLHTKSHFDVG